MPGINLSPERRYYQMQARLANQLAALQRQQQSVITDPTGSYPIIIEGPQPIEGTVYPMTGLGVYEPVSGNCIMYIGPGTYSTITGVPVSTTYESGQNLTATQTTIPLTSPIGPTTGEFIIGITIGSDTEVMMVTGGQGTTTLTVERSALSPLSGTGGGWPVALQATPATCLTLYDTAGVRFATFSPYTTETFTGSLFGGQAVTQGLIIYEDDGVTPKVTIDRTGLTQA